MANLDSQYVIYTSVALPYIDTDPNDTLQAILGKINTAINASSAAPNYSGYNLYCITQTDGITHPTNTQNFAEGISKIVCDNKDEYDTFVGTDYVADQLVLTNAITALQAPGLTYAPFSIVNTDLIGAVYTKMFAGFTAITASIDPSAAAWSTIGVTPDPDNIVDAFDEIITYILGLASDITGKEDAIGTFDNSANCLSGTGTDTAGETIDLLTTYICTLPLFDYTNITFGGVTPGTDLETTVQSLVDTENYLLTNGVIAVGVGLALTAVGGTYDGMKVAIDPTYSGLFKVKGSSDDTTGNYLENKIVAGTGISVVTLNPGGNETIEITNDSPADGKVQVNSSDSNPGYLQDKLPYTNNSAWGIGLTSSPTPNNNQLELIPSVDPDTLFAAMMDYISNTPTLFTQFQALVNQTSGGACTAPSSLSVVINVADFDLTWTPSGTATTQNVKYREANTINWILTPNVTPANPQAQADAAATVENLTLNTIYDFAVDSVCSGGGLGTSNVYQMVIYDCAVVTDQVAAQQISVTQNPLSTLDTIDYRLVDSVSVVVESISTSAQEPSVTFTAVSAGDYTVEWRYNGTVNGVNLSSDDVSQLNAWCSTATITVT